LHCFNDIETVKNRIGMTATNVAIKVENLRKIYRIGLKEETHDSIGGAFIDFLKSPLKNYRKYRSLYKFDKSIVEFEDDSENPTADVIVAVRDVSFTIMEGEVVGIIGKNGSGKSTLLKILSRITSPTRGRAEIRGRVSSLLEVGTGFHPELTGRENVYLNATILGMTKKEVDTKFDDIVAFSGIEKFIDTPIKRYSSGMKVRLAFSVAAHLEAEILVIDEVLAVGDAAFQNKCLAKMDEIAHHGRTVLFVSHNMAAVQNLCDRVLVMDDGRLILDGDTDAGIAAYMEGVLGGSDDNQVWELPRESGMVPVIREVEFLNGSAAPVSGISSGNTLTVRIHYKHRKSLTDPYFGIRFESTLRTNLFLLQTRIQKGHLPDLPPEGFITCHIPRVPLLPGSYYISVGCGTANQQLDYIHRARQLQIVESDVFGTGKLPPPTHGMLIVDADWEI
jgi:lipopolysaccharide transport system ATP-binding protein